MKTEQMEQVELRPFHETIVDAISQASNSSALACLMALIEATKIPKGHDEIIVALRQRQIKLVGLSDLGTVWADPRTDELIDCLLTQKQAVEVDKHKNAVLDELEREREVARMRRE